MANPGEKGAKQSFQVREVRPADLDRGLIETLSHLSDMAGLTPKEAKKILGTMKKTQLYHVFVAATPEGEVVGATTLLVEQKFIHRGGIVGHIEDVSVREGYEARGVGRSLVSAAVALARELGCYKCILDCKADLAGFYEGLGFRRHEIGMRIDL
jgi:glucosamine-phosphate N-acetyltransferase